MWLQMIGTISNYYRRVLEKSWRFQSHGAGILDLIFVRLQPFLLATLVAVWLFAHSDWLIGIALAAALLSTARAIVAGPL